MHLDTLNPQQRTAALAPAQPLLIVAGAGTGKTLTLTSRVAHTIKSGVQPQRICAVTFTNKAAREMEVRIMRLIGSSFTPRSKPFIGTFHALGAHILRKEGKRFGRTPAFTIFDTDDSFRLIKNIVKATKAAVKETPSFFTQHITQLKNGVTAPANFAQSKKSRDRAVIDIFDTYEAALERSNAFDFDDLIQKVVRLFRDNPDVLDRYRKRFTHVFVDEYQDLNNEQYEFVRLLVGNSPHISVVGDDAQMIYSFRGSNFQIFLDFEKDWGNSKVVLLEENYRSTPTIIEAASALITHNRRQRPKSLWTNNNDNGPITLLEAVDENGEAGWVADTISGFQLPTSNKRGAHTANRPQIENGMPSTAVLYRTNAQSRAVEQALIHASIPYSIFGGVKFYERREIKDVVAALRLVLNPRDGVSRDRLEKNLTKKMSSALWGILAHSPDTQPSSLIEGFLRATDYLGFLERRFTNAGDRKDNVAEFLHFASRFTNLTQFLEEIALVQPTDPIVPAVRGRGSRAGGNSAVNLMTIHLAKGLEFDHVFVIGCAEGLLPHARSLTTQEELEEERRLMYVAMTRAKKVLSLSFYGIPSRFLTELPAELVQYKNTERDFLEIDDLDDEGRYITLE